MLVDPPGGGISQCAIRSLGDLGHQPFKKGRFRIVVALGHPHPLAPSRLYAFVPLSESAAAIRLAIDDMAHMRIAAIALHNIAATVGRTVVQQYQLKVLEGLPQNAVDTLPQIRSVVVVGHYDRDGGHGVCFDLCLFRNNLSGERIALPIMYA